MHKNARCVHAWQSVHGHTAGCLRAFEPATRKDFTHKNTSQVQSFCSTQRSWQSEVVLRREGEARLQSALLLTLNAQGRARTVEPPVASCAHVRGVSRGSQARSTSSEARNITRGRKGRLSGEAGSPSCHNTALGDRAQYKQLARTRKLESDCFDFLKKASLV